MRAESPFSNAPLISVALCTYNGAAHLQEQMESIAAQTRAPGELVICDDRSLDATPQIVAGFAKIAPFPVRFLVNEQKLGSSKNFEKALKECHGEFIALSDQDDAWRADRLEMEASFLENRAEYGGVFSNGELMDEKSKPTHGLIWDTVNFDAERQREFAAGEVAKVLLKNNVVTGATLMLRRSVLALCTPFPSSWVHDGWIAWMLALHSRIGFLDEPLIRYRIHGNQQVGLPPSSDLQKVRRAQRTKGEAYSTERKMFQELMQYLEGTGNHAELKAAIERKISLLRFRESLPSNGAPRMRGVLTRAGLYREYSQGWKSMVKDMLLRA